MAEFILILHFLYPAPAATAVLFPSQQACETAKTQALELSRARAVCVPRNAP